MKTIVEKFNAPADTSFSVRNYVLLSADYFRVHETYELSAIRNCGGKRFIGNSIGNFKEGELILLGPNLPHCIHLNDETDYEDINTSTVHFNERSFGVGFFETPQNMAIKRLMEKSKLGIHFYGEVADEMKERVFELVDLKPFDRMISFLEILNILALNSEYDVLTSPGYIPHTNIEAHEKVNIVYDYVLKNFQNDLSLNDISSKLNCAPATFCRFFKKHTHKTFSQYLNEVRIGHACKLLIESDKSIAEVGYASGFNHLTHFNRQFKKLMDMSPRTYRMRFDNVG